MKENKEQQASLPDLNAFQVKYVPAGDMQKLKEKPTKPIHPVAQRVATELLKNPETGARFELNTPALQQMRDQLKALLSRGLRQLAKREKKDLKVRCISRPNEMVFYYEAAKTKDKKSEAK